MSFLSPKALRAEVTEGIDLESEVFLTGDRITIGASPNDTLTLGAGQVVPEHLTLIRQPGAKQWEYFTSDRGQTQVDRGNPRTGTVRPGMWFRLGPETRIDISRAPLPADLLTDADGKEAKKEVPLPVALGIMAVLLVAFGAYVSSMGSSSDTGASLNTAAWFAGAAPLAPSLDTCLATGAQQAAANGGIRVPPSAPDALFRAHVALNGSDPDRAATLKADLARDIQATFAQAHLLVRESRFFDAADTLRRLENVLPVGTGNCPILSAVRGDLAVLEMQGARR